MSHSKLANRSHLIDVIASVVDEKLLVEWQYNYAIHKKETIQNLFDNFHSFLLKITQLIQSGNRPNYSPSDFKDISLSQNDINQILNEITSPFDQDSIDEQ